MNNNSVQLSYLLGMAHTSKPANIAAEKTVLARPEALVTTTVSQLVQYLLAGHTICPAVLQGGMATEHWTSQQLFMTDHDTGLTIEQALVRCRDKGTMPDFAYHTFGSTLDVPKFRLGFLLDEPVINESDRQSVMNYLLSAFPEADQSCKDAPRIFFGAGQLGVIECYQHLPF